MQVTKRKGGLALLVAACLSAGPLSVSAQPLAAQGGSAGPTYADLVDLSDSAQIVLRAQVRSMARVEDERAPGLRAGQGRFYIRARTRALLTGSAPVGESLAYLVDLPLDPRGRPPAIKGKEVIVFARRVAGSPGEIRLVAPDAQLVWSEELETRLRPILAELAAADRPPAITGVRELIHVPGALAGEGETQMFLETADGSAASITVRHSPGRPPAWGVSFSELVADVGNPPRRETLAWYRLACFLPNSLPAGANLSETASRRAQAQADYRTVLGELGACRRSRK